MATPKSAANITSLSSPSKGEKLGLSDIWSAGVKLTVTAVVRSTNIVDHGLSGIEAGARTFDRTMNTFDDSNVIWSQETVQQRSAEHKALLAKLKQDNS